MRNRGKRPRSRARHRQIDPLQQGELDGLCGVYATINAIRLLCLSMSKVIARDLFEVLLRAIKRRRRDVFANVSHGISSPLLYHLLKVAIAFVRRRLGVGLKVERLPRRIRQSSKLQQVWDHLQQAVADGSVIVLALFGRCEHWSVVAAMTRRTIELFDSDKFRLLRRSYCSLRTSDLRYSFSATDTFVVSRVKTLGQL